MEHIALSVFTIFLQTAIGLITFVTIARLIDQDGIFKRAIIAAAGFASIGILTSFLHLGRPTVAFYSILRFGNSWLSREIVFASAFIGLTILVALLVYFKPQARKETNILLVIASLVGLVNIYAMSSIYTSSSVPTWHHFSVAFEFYTAAISLGAVMFLLASWKEAVKTARFAAITAGAALIFQIVAIVIYYIDMGVSTSSAAQQSLYMLANMKPVLIMQWTFNLFGVSMLFYPLYNANVRVDDGVARMELAPVSEKSIKMSVIIAAILLFIGQLITRYLFFAIMVASSLGLI